MRVRYEYVHVIRECIKFICNFMRRTAASKSIAVNKSYYSNGFKIKMYS